MINYLYAAYIVTWVIHIAYLGWLTHGYRKAKEEIEELRK